MNTPSTKGFAKIDPEKRRRISAMGGRAAHAKGTAHRFSSEEARIAGSLRHGAYPGLQRLTPIATSPVVTAFGVERKGDRLSDTAVISQ